MVGVRVEARSGGAHAADERDGRDAAGGGARRRDAAADLGAAVHGVDRAVGGVEELAHVRRRRRRAQPASLVRLVPDEPASHPAVARRGGAGEAGERRCAGSEVRRPTAVGPARRADQPDHGRDAARPEAVQDEIGLGPVRLAGSALDPVPVQVEADDVDAERLEPVEPVLDRAAAVREPGVVLDPEADSTRGIGRRSSEAQQADENRCDCEAHRQRVPGRLPSDT